MNRTYINVGDGPVLDLDRLGSSIVGRILGTTDHDILVPTSSSMPTLRAAPTQPLPNRTHFDYFTRLPSDSPHPARPPHFKQAIARMQLWVPAPA